jgi:hypothetical protein
MQREKRLRDREQFELEHEDASMSFTADYLGEDDLITQIELIRKNRQKQNNSLMASLKR